RYENISAFVEAPAAVSPLASKFSEPLPVGDGNASTVPGAPLTETSRTGDHDGEHAQLEGPLCRDRILGSQSGTGRSRGGNPGAVCASGAGRAGSGELRDPPFALRAREVLLL